jgi:hypothetical protein
MTTFMRINEHDDPVNLAEVATQHHALLTEALGIATRMAEDKPDLVREILATCTVEGLATKLDSKAAALSFRAEKYKRTWHSLIPWQNLAHTTAEDEAESMIQTIEANIEMTEANSWPPLPPDGK